MENPLFPKDAIEHCANLIKKEIDQEILDKIVEDAKEIGKEARNHLQTTFVREKAFREGR